MRCGNNWILLIALLWKYHFVGPMLASWNTNILILITIKRWLKHSVWLFVIYMSLSKPKLNKLCRISNKIYLNMRSLAMMTLEVMTQTTLTKIRLSQAKIKMKESKKIKVEFKSPYVKRLLSILSQQRRKNDNSNIPFILLVFSFISISTLKIYKIKTYIIEYY